MSCKDQLSRETTMPISPLEAINRLSEPVTVEMLVKRAKSCTRSLQFFLDSEVTAAPAP